MYLCLSYIKSMDKTIKCIKKIINFFRHNYYNIFLIIMISSQGTTTFVTFKVSGLSSMPSPININNTSILLGKTTILTNLTLADNSTTILNNTTNKGSLYISGPTRLNGPTTILSSLNISGTTSLNGPTTILSTLKINDSLIVSGPTSLNGPTTVSSSLDILGNLNISNSLSTSNIISLGTTNLNGPTTVASSLDILGNLNISNITSLGTTSLNGPTTIGSSLDILGNLNISNITSLGTTNLNGPTTILSSLDILGNLNISNMTSLGTTSLNGPTTILSTLNILGNLNTSNMTSLGTTSLNGPTTILSTLNISGNLSTFNMTSLGTTSLNGPTTVLSSLNISGATSLNGPTTILSFLNISGITNLNGPLNINSISKSTILGSLDIGGDLNILGSTTYLNTETVNIKDNLILINSNQTETPSPLLQGGIEVERGPLNNYRFVFVESDESFKIGVYNTSVSELQSVATRENVPILAGIPYWNSSQSRFDTNSNITFDNQNNNVILSSLTVSGQTNLLSTLNTSALNVTGTSNLNGGITVSGPTNLLSGLNISTLTVTGITNLNGGLTISGTTNLLSGLNMATINVTGVSNLNGGVNISGTTNILSGLNISTLNVTGSSNLNGGVTVSGVTRLLSSVSITGSTNMYGGLSVTGTTNLSNGVNITGTTVISGNTTIYNNISISETTDTYDTNRIVHFPPVILTANTQVIQHSYCNGTVTIETSGGATDWGASNMYYLFDRNLSINYIASRSGAFNLTAPYDYAKSTQYFTNNSYLGMWLKITYPENFILKYFSIFARTLNESPDSWRLYGSTSGSSVDVNNWTLLYEATSAVPPTKRYLFSDLSANVTPFNTYIIIFNSVYGSSTMSLREILFYGNPLTNLKLNTNAMKTIQNSSYSTEYNTFVSSSNFKLSTSSNVVLFTPTLSSTNNLFINMDDEVILINNTTPLTSIWVVLPDSRIYTSSTKIITIKDYYGNANSYNIGLTCLNPTEKIDGITISPTAEDFSVGVSTANFKISSSYGYITLCVSSVNGWGVIGGNCYSTIQNNVSGASILVSSALNISGPSGFYNGLTISGSTNIYGTMTLSGNSNITNNLSITGTTNMYGLSNIKSNLVVTGTSSFRTINNIGKLSVDLNDSTDLTTFVEVIGSDNLTGRPYQCPLYTRGANGGIGLNHSTNIGGTIYSRQGLQIRPYSTDTTWRTIMETDGWSNRGTNIWFYTYDQSQSANTRLGMTQRLQITNNTTATSLTAGTVQISGGLAVSDKLYCSGLSSLNDSTFNSNLSVSGNVTISNGITFPSVSGASTLVLSSYAEGTWTPTMAFGTFTLTTQYGTYTKIGRTVHLMGQVIWSAKSGSGSLAIGGVPFTPLSYRTGINLGWIAGMPNYQIIGTFSAINSNIYIRKVVSGTATDVTVTETGSTGELTFQLTYFV